MKGKRVSRRKYNFAILAIVIIASVLLLLFSVGFSLYLSAMSAYEPPAEEPLVNPDGSEGKGEDNQGEPAKPSSKYTRKKDVYTYIVGGTDIDGTRTDTMILVYFAPKENVLNLLQIPRDTFIDMGKKSNKANALYAFGKGPLLRQGVSEAFGIEIDNYAVLNLSSFRTIVDKLGGVEVDVPFNMDYEDPYQELYIHLKKGKQVLDGEEAEGFVRFRYGYTDMDVGRMNAQKIFLAAAAKTVLKPSNLLKIPSIIDTVFKNLKTDMKAGDMLSIATKALGVPLENIRIFTVPGEPWYYKGESGFTAYRDETMYIINNFFNPYEEYIDDAKLTEHGRKYDVKADLEGKSLVEIDADRPKFHLNPKWDWKEHLAKAKGH